MMYLGLTYLRNRNIASEVESRQKSKQDVNLKLQKTGLGP